MSSLHQDRLLDDGQAPASGTSKTVDTASGTSRRPAGPAEEDTTSVPTQRQGKAPRSTTTRTSSTRSGSTRTVSAEPAAKRATAKPAAAKTAAKPAAAEPVAKTAAKPAAAKKATAKTAAKPAAAKSAATEPAVAKPVATKSAAKPAAAKKAGPRHAAPSRSQAVSRPRPTPHKRTGPTVAELLAALDGTPADGPIETPGRTPVETPVKATTVAPEVAAEVAAEIVDGRRQRFLERRPAVEMPRRPTLYLAAAFVGALSFSAVATGDPAAQADTETVSQSVSVAEQLGIEAAEPTQVISDAAATERLGELVASRNTRDAEQAAAAQAQAEADRIAAEAAAEAARPKAVLPVDGARLTSTYGPRWGTMHSGIDLAAPMRTPEYAVMDGVVLEAGAASGFGLAVYIQHENGDVTVYGHMDEILVEAGQVVRAGDTIALLGNRGQSTGPHLHFEVRVGGVNGQKIDPLPWLRERGINI